MQEIYVRIHTPEYPDHILDGTLFLGEQSRPRILYHGQLKAQSYWQTLPVIFAEGKTNGEKYSLVDCVFKSSNLIDQEYIVNELYRNEWVSKSNDDEYDTINFSITHLTDFLNHSRFRPSIVLSEATGQVNLEPSLQFKFDISKDFILELEEFCTFTFGANNFNIANNSKCKIVSKNGSDRRELFALSHAFIKLISLFTDRMPRTLKITYDSQHRELEHVVHIGKKITTTEGSVQMKFTELQEHWANAISLYYAKRREFENVIDLLNESRTNATAEVCFLNLTTALEVFHKNFLSPQFPDKYKEIRKVLLTNGFTKNTRNEWSQVERYYHICELLEKLTVFGNFIKDKVTLAVKMRDSRNYYVHYEESSVVKWTPEELFNVNNELQNSIRALILSELQVPYTLINTLISRVAEKIYKEINNNAYSVFYKGIND